MADPPTEAALPMADSPAEDATATAEEKLMVDEGDNKDAVVSEEQAAIEPEEGDNDDDEEVEIVQPMDVAVDDAEEEKARQDARAMNADAFVEELENKHALLQEEHEAAREQLESQTKDLSATRDQVKTLNEEKLVLEQQLAETKRTAQSAGENNKTMEQEQKSKKERVDRMEAEADSLREEISRVTKSNKEYQASLSDMEVKSKLSNSEVTPLIHENQRLQTEIDSVTTHSQWLEGELKRSTDEHMGLKKSSGARATALQNDVHQLTQEKESEAARNLSLTRSEAELRNKVENLSKKLMHEKQDQLEANLAADQEMIAERRLVNLQEEQMARLEKKHDDVVLEMQALQTKASQALELSRNERHQRVERQNDATNEALEIQATKYDTQLKDLARQVKDLDRRRLNAEDSFLSKTEAAPLAITAGGDDDDAGPITMTDLSTRLSDSQNELNKERIKRKKVELRFERVQADIEAKAPLFTRQRQEYEEAMKRQDDTHSRLQDQANELRVQRAELHEVNSLLNQAKKESRTLDMESKSLAKQVQALLMSRSGAIPESGDIPTSIAEIQGQNQRLLGEIRLLTGTVKELENKLKSDSLRLKLDTAEKELATLREDREQQAALVAGIVQQRDLYRALLSKHDSKLLGTEEEEVTAIELTKRQSDRAKAFESKNNDLENDLAVAKDELDRATRDKETALERLARNETLVISLTKSVDDLQMEVSTAKSDAARTRAECSYQTDRASAMELSLRNAKDETGHVANAKNQLQRINNELQNAVSNANSESSRLESERRQLESKHKMAEAQVNTIKAAEKRTVEENNQLRNELARQGGLLDSVRRIESSLAAKKDEEAAKVKEECEKLTIQLAKQDSKHATEIENLQSKVHDLEVRTREVGSSNEKAKKESLLAQKKVLSKQEEIQKLTTKCSTLASQLHALRKKYGETDDSTDVDVTLQARIKTLSAELEAAKADLATQKEAVENFQRIAKTSEAALADLTKSTQEFRKARDEEISTLNATIAEVKKEGKAKHEMVTELTNDLMKVRGENDQVVETLKTEGESLKKQLESLEKDSESANARVAALTLDQGTSRENEAKAQNNYEHELEQHAAARIELRKARTEAEEERRNRVSAEESLNALQKESDGLRGEYEQEKKSIEEALQNAEKRLKDAQGQHEVLHSQLETLGQLAEKNQESRVAAAAGDGETGDQAPGTNAEASALNKTITELREVVRFLRSEKEMMQAQVDAAKRTAERERSAATVIKRSLDEARAELKVVASVSTTSAEHSNVKELTKKFQSAEDQLRLLRDSNQLLREEAEKLQGSLASVQLELGASKLSAQPAEKRQRELEVQKASMEAEMASLKREIDSWKKRVQSLVSNFNQIDPEEHKRALDKIETMNTETAALKSTQANAANESTRMRNIATKLTKEVAQQKKLNEMQKKMIAQMTTQKDAQANSKNAQAATERDLLKEKVAKVEKDLGSLKTELEGANQRNSKLVDRLRQFQKMIKDLRVKEKSLAKQLLEAQTSQQQPTTPTENVSAVTPALATLTVPAADTMHKKQEVKNDPPKSDATIEPAAVANAAKEELLKVPPGGFKFGPNDGAVPAKTEAPAAIQTPSVTTKPAPVAENPALTAATPAFVPAAARPTSPKPATARPDSPKPLLLTKAAASPVPVDFKASPPRRGSGAKQEMSMKERLMEKKRLLQEKMQKKKDLAARKEAHASETKDGEDISEPALKRSKLGTGAAKADDKTTTDIPMEASEEMTPVPVAVAEKPKPMEAEVKIEDDDDEDGEVAETPATENTQEKEKEPKASPSSAPAAFGTSSGFGSAPFGTATTFGGAVSAAPFGTSGAPPFGTGATSTFGSTSAAATPSLGFGSVATAAATTLSAFGGAKTDSSSGGGAFLSGMTPPGDQAAAPTFPFGRSGSITLPTPSQPVRTASSSSGSPFGMFGASSGQSSSPFGAFAPSSGPKPLFGQPSGTTPVAAVEETKAGDVATGEGAKEDATKSEE